MNRHRKPLIAGNWKMNNGGLAGLELAASCCRLALEVPSVELVVAPPFTALAAVAQECEEAARGSVRVGVAGQNMHAKKSGAFTGEISPPMLKESGCAWVLLGHSERRQFFGETDASVAEKTEAAFDAGLLPMVCVGETLAERDAGKTLAVVETQLAQVLPIFARRNVPAAIAYEPVWAIGTGKNAGAHEAEEVHEAIRHWLEKVSPTLAQSTRVLYGGSVKADNAAALLGCPNVDGALVGGASLDVTSFGAIARAAQQLATGV